MPNSTNPFDIPIMETAAAPVQGNERRAYTVILEANRPWYFYIVGSSSAIGRLVVIQDINRLTPKEQRTLDSLQEFAEKLQGAARVMRSQRNPYPPDRVSKS